MPGSKVAIGERLSISDVHCVARAHATPTFDDKAKQALRHTRQQLERDLAAGASIYGVNTGFGALSDTPVAPERLSALQHNLLRSHAMGVGRVLDDDVVRALLLLRAHTLALGASGASPELVQGLLDMLEADVIPVVPRQGSVGASGDLAPLAHLALVLVGEGEAFVAGERLPGAEALARVGLTPRTLGPKEGLSLINGTQLTSALGALAVWDAGELLLAADILGALTLDASLGSVHPFDARIHAGKPHPGQQRSAALVSSLLHGSPLNASHERCGRMQDAYSLRCMPQVHGATRQAFHYVAKAVEIEINSLTDNPLVLRDPNGSYEVVSGGNFHAATVALALDHLTAALTTLATISERRLDRLLDDRTSIGLPAFLADSPGYESGFMMLQVTASALASECKTLSFPAAVDTIPTSAGKEDHVSMGPIAACKLAQVVGNVANVLAIEAAVAARALDLRAASTSDALVGVYGEIRRHVDRFGGDRSMGAEVEALGRALLAGAIRQSLGLAHELAWRQETP